MSVMSKFYYVKHRKFIKCEDIKHNKILIVSCETINKRFKEYHIQTTHNEVMEILDLINIEKTRFSEKWRKKRYEKDIYKRFNIIGFQRDKMNRILRNIEMYSDKELNCIFEKNNQQWGNWCNDCILFHCYNKILNNVCIPIMENKNNMYVKALTALKNSRMFK